MSERIDLKDLSKEELRNALAAIGQPPYRAIQVFTWMYREGTASFEHMENLPRGLREALSKRYRISSLKLLDTKRSRLDGTIKYLLKLEDGHAIETVSLPERGRATTCVSSQVGCKRSCSFCASSVLGFERNLTTAEILNEVLFVRHDTKSPVTHVVFMGIGEPFDNYRNVMKAVRILNDSDGMNIGARRITVSTCGIVPGIEALSREGLQVELSVSLHAAEDVLRTRLVPVNKRYPIGDLMAACREYTRRTNRIITFEYVLMKGVNCADRDAGKLASLLRGMKCKVNLIACNQIRALGYEAPSREEAKTFLERLLAHGVRSTLRRSRGEDIDAGCGQLRVARCERE